MSDKQPGQRIRIRSVRRNPLDVRKMSRALIAVAYAQAEAEAKAEAEHRAGDQKPSPVTRNAARQNGRRRGRSGN